MTEPGRAAEVPRAMDSGWFRRVLGHYPTGVSVVTGIAPDGAPLGLAVGSFTSVSLEPPLVAFLPSAGSSSWPKIRKAGRFCVNILAADQEAVCRAFATRGADKFAGLNWRPAGSGAPILEGAVAWVDCELEAVHEAGDHLIVVGRVWDLEVGRSTLPLLFFQGGYGRFSPHSLAVGDARFGRQLQLLDSARPLMESVADRTGAQVAAAHCDGRELTLLATAGSLINPRVPSVAIGQRLPLIPPLGIWWMAFATEDQVDRWLGSVDSATLRGRYRDALAQIRERGYCLGLVDMETQIEVVINRRAHPDREPTPEERRLIAELDLDPLDYVPAATLPSRLPADVVSLWAPCFTRDSEPALGLMLTGFDLGSPAHSFVKELLELSGAITGMAAGVSRTG